MNNLAIRVDGLGKEYVIGERKEKYKTLRDSVAKWASSSARKARALLGADSQAGPAISKFWALRDVSFEVSRGEVVGIIGRNGAGKSTLLKILSRITAPTEGGAEIHGRVGSLLEVGTGFHPELTGRENIYLNGAILGMRRAEIEANFDEMVEFAEVGKFVDTPVKHYSSGMYLRLAFAVAAHLSPEVLIVDEVLAVGDAAFQKKCLGKMNEVAKTGRTVLFVSHNMGAIATLCSRALVLEQGEAKFDGPPDRAIATYLQQIRRHGEVSLRGRHDRAGNKELVFTSIAFLNKYGQPIDTIISGDDVTVELNYEIAGGAVENAVFLIGFYDSMGQLLFSCFTRPLDQNFPSVPSQTVVRCAIPKFPLAAGTYSLNIFCKVDGYTMADHVEGAAEVDVVEGDFFGTGKMMPREGGPVLVSHHWELFRRQV